MTVSMFAWLIWGVGDFESLLCKGSNSRVVSVSLGRESRCLILGMACTPILDSCGDFSNLHWTQNWLRCQILKFHT